MGYKELSGMSTEANLHQVRQTSKQKDSGLARGFLSKPARKPRPASEGNTAPAASKPSTPSTASVASSTASVTRHAAVVREEAAGECLFRARNYSDARSAFERMRDAARTEGLVREEGVALKLLADTLDKLKAPDAEIDSMHQQAMKIAHKEDDMNLSFQVLLSMGSHSMNTDELELAEHSYLQALTLAQRVLTNQEVAVAESCLGTCLGKNGKRGVEGFQHFRKAISLHTTDGVNWRSTVEIHSNYAEALSAHGKHIEAERQYQTALKVARDHCDQCVEADILTHLANLYDSHLDSPDKARECRSLASAGEQGASAEQGYIRLSES